MSTILGLSHLFYILISIQEESQIFTKDYLCYTSKNMGYFCTFLPIFLTRKSLNIRQIKNTAYFLLIQTYVVLHKYYQTVKKQVYFLFIELCYTSSNFKMVLKKSYIYVVLIGYEHFSNLLGYNIV